MHRTSSRTVSALALAFAAGGALSAAGPVPAARAAIAKAPEPAHAAAAKNHLRSLQPQMGLSNATDFKVHHAFTNEQGETIVRLDQTYLGYPVLSGSAIVQLGADGVVQKVVNGLVPSIQLTGAPALTADQALAIALKNLAAKGPLDGTPSVTQVVFPSGMTGGFVAKLDPDTGKAVIDRELSTWAKRPVSDYVWAYEVKTSLRNSLDGMKQICFIVDGDTGAILRKGNDLKSASAQGTGNSLYNGTVVLSTTQSAANSTYALTDSTRGTLPSPFWFTGNNVGLSTFYDSIAPSPFGGNEVLLPYAGNATNAWGDGLIFTGTSVYTDPATGAFWWNGAASQNGQTAAVDAQFGMATTWDLFLKVFGRNGMDNKGTTIDALVHPFGPSLSGAIIKMPNHFSNVYNGGVVMLLGDGTYPADPNGRGPQTEMDIVAHEMTHAFTASTANFNLFFNEAYAMDEATCDIFGQAAKAYALRAPGADTTIPDFAASNLNNWTFGYNADFQKPERYFYKPSLDGLSADAYYDGIGNLWPWFASGPINRMFYFLVNGASSVPTDPTYSPYLPGGMVGIGIDKASRIWFKAVSESLLSDSALGGTRPQDALPAADAAATALFTAGSPEELAVLNAFYAVNIGNGAPGQPKHVSVTFPVIHAPGTILGNGGANFQPGMDARIQFFPPATAVKVQVDVHNTANTAVTWSSNTLGYLDQTIQAGTFNADGTWTTPVSPSADWEPFLLTATSQADPSQFAKGSVLIISIDADMDTEPDALDLGQIAMSWGLTSSQNPYAAYTNIWSNGNAGDWDVALFSEVLTNTWPAK